MAEDRIKCPVCAELIKPDAKKCRFCGEWLGGSEGAKAGVMPREPLEPPVDGQEGWHEAKAGESEGKSREPEPVKKVETTSVGKKRPFPWLRIILFISYAAIVAALVCSERSARQTLRVAREKEEASDPNGALVSYSDIVFRFPFSFTFMEAQEGLRRLCGSDKSKMPRPPWLDAIEDVLGKETTVCEVYPLLFVVWPACAVLLALVFLTRILRPGMALFVLALLAAAVAGSVVQLSWYETVLPRPIAKGLFEEPMVLYSVTYALLVVTALMTLTATRKRRSRSVSKMAMARK